uniref:Homeobox domain-containing protein n=1 Tax=Seriola dumerili TaxID=41447 RepID=A0A3B4TRS6_SERDU
MRKMRHIADGRLRQNTADACGETPTEINITPVPFNMNQNSAVCLPLLSESQKLIWVHSNQIDVQLDGAAELDKAFDMFPYLTQKQTAALAQRCSLHPDQVKVWFMAQRLRYGISWDYKDIRQVQKKFKSSEGKALRKQDLQNGMGEVVKEKRREKKKKRREVKASDGKKEGKVREEQGANEGRMMGESVRANKRLERNMVQEQLMNKDIKVAKVEGDKRNTQKRRKRMAVPDTMGKKRMKQGNDGIVGRAGDLERGDQVEREAQKSIQSERTRPTRAKKEKANKLMSVNEWPADKIFVVPDEPLDVSPLLFNVPPLSDKQTEVLERVDVIPPPTRYTGMTTVNSGFEGKPEMETRLEREVSAELTNNIFVTDVGKLKELLTISPVVDSSSTFNPQQASHVIDACTLHSPVHCSAKSQSQLRMMKIAFARCQYPKSEDYDRLAMLIGIPRYVLVKWFGDMRYYVKKGKPTWLNREQHSRALANIRYWQYVNALVKAQSSEGRRTRRKKPVSKSSGKDESMKVPLQ